MTFLGLHKACLAIKNSGSKEMIEVGGLGWLYGSVRGTYVLEEFGIITLGCKSPSTCLWLWSLDQLDHFLIGTKLHIVK